MADEKTERLIQKFIDKMMLLLNQQIIYFENGGCYFLNYKGAYDLDERSKEVSPEK